MRRFLKIILLCLFFLAGTAARAQFREEAFSQQYNDDADTLGRDTSDVMFSLKDYFAGIRHTRPQKIGTMFGGSAVFVGGQQMYNRQYWKLPVIYGGLAATAGLGIYYGNRYGDSGDSRDKRMRNLMYAGAGLIYWGTLMDGVVNYPSDDPHLPGRATLYSLLLPGLGQAYNHEYWKIPLYYTGMVVSASLLINNSTNYRRYTRIHNEATSGDGTYTGNIPAQTALYYRNVYRRYRDYSVVALAGFYLLQVIDANVFAYMQDFEVNDDISLNLTPAILPPDNAYAFGGGTAAFGMRIGLRF